MENASLYTSANSLQRQEARHVLHKFITILPLKKGSKILDVGCGSGDVTAEILMPLLPKDVEVIGTDISLKMIKYAQETYSSSRLSFSQMDIADEGKNLSEKLIINNNNLKLEKSGKELNSDIEIRINGLKLVDEQENEHKKTTNDDQRFDIVFSFFCLHWIQNQRQALTNIFGFLKEKGEAVLVFLVNAAVFTLYQRLAEIPMWSSYMTDVDRYISPYYHSEDPAKDFSELVSLVGFEAVSIECHDSIFVYPDTETLKEAIKAVNPFYTRLEENQKDCFLSDCISIVNKHNLIEKGSDGLQVSYKLIVAHLRKPTRERKFKSSDISELDSLPEQNQKK